MLSSCRCAFVAGLFSVMLMLGVTNGAEAGQSFEPWKTSSDPVALLWQKIEAGTAKLDTGSEKAFLTSVLKQLRVPVESQVLVFSKTSLQNALIHPLTPRAVYYSEEVYVGWVQGGATEIICIDPEQGPQFYTLSYPFAAGERPVLANSEQCLSCHEGARTNGVKGMVVRSVYPDENGQPTLKFGSFTTGQDSPLSERWGGWYVTGKHGSDRHMGNIIAHEKDERVTLERDAGANVTSLDKFISTEPYITKTSDIVSLMVLEHQCTMHNLLTGAAKSTREAMARQHGLQEAFNEPLTDEPQGSALSVVNGQAEKILKHLLFTEEYALQDHGVEGAPAFQEAFRSNRHETKEGRSLKDFQLLTRLFKHRCSYMIYSKSFEALPLQLKKAFYTQLWDVLEGRNGKPEYANLSTSEREHIKEILLETKPEAGVYWKGLAGR